MAAEDEWPPRSAVRKGGGAIQNPAYRPAGTFGLMSWAFERLYSSVPMMTHSRCADPMFGYSIMTNGNRPAPTRIFTSSLTL